MSKNRYVALLRGINVGGKNPMKMNELRDCLQAAGLSELSTYIASGNVLFSSERSLRELESDINTALHERFGYSGPTVVLSKQSFLAVVNEAPDGFGQTPEQFHSDVIFLKQPTTASEDLRDVLGLRLKDGVDTARAGSMALYFTRLSARRTSSRMSKILELPSYSRMTVRSWKTVQAIRSLLEN
jgi:uncharacterized protein (DUF1697 family)